MELCGLPGAGKSTLARRLGGASADDVVLVDARVAAAAPLPVRLGRKLVLVGREAATSPWQEVMTARALLRGQSGRDRLAVPAQWLLARRLLDQAHRAVGTAAVVEEGLVQALWTAGVLRRGGPDADGLLDLASSASRPDLVVHLQVSVATVLTRLRSRGSRHSRVQHLPPAEQLITLRHGEDLLGSLLQGWQQRAYGDVLVVSGDDGDPVGAVAAAVRTRANDLAR